MTVRENFTAAGFAKMAAENAAKAAASAKEANEASMKSLKRIEAKTTTYPQIRKSACQDAAY